MKAYIDTIKIARDMGPGSGLAPHLVRPLCVESGSGCVEVDVSMNGGWEVWAQMGGDQGGILPRSMMSHLGGGENQQSGMSISPGSSHADMEHWMGGGFDSPLLPSFSSHYVTGDGGMSGRRSTLRYGLNSTQLAGCVPPVLEEVCEVIHVFEM